jgi:hypothetical protein
MYKKKGRKRDSVLKARQDAYRAEGLANPRGDLAKFKFHFPGSQQKEKRRHG